MAKNKEQPPRKPRGNYKSEEDKLHSKSYRFKQSQIDYVKDKSVTEEIGENEAARIVMQAGIDIIGGNITEP